jgi:predicted glycoside hydrolase/deacetylase ChbG (UPF0249 family)
MVPCPWAYEAARRFSGFDVGVHLTLTAEYPPYRWRALTGARSLHNSEGFLPLTAEEVFARADVDEARTECRAQIEQALAWGVDVTHLDTHMGAVQTDPRFFAIYVDLAAEYRLPLRMISAGGEARLGFPSRAPAMARGVVFPDHFLYAWGRSARDLLLSALPGLRPGVSEIFFHPVRDGPELRGYDRRGADMRVADYAALMDRDLIAAIAAAGATPISFRPLRELQRNAA